MRIACVGYREWALQIYDNLAQSLSHEFLILRGKTALDERTIALFNPDLILFYGWSDRIPDTIFTKYTSLMLHPSPLPYYRGGSPIQNQIIRGEKHSKVTVFIITHELDAGDIVASGYLNLEGSLDEIFQRIVAVGTELTENILRDGLQPVPQDHTKATIYKRRKPSESEITIDEIMNESAEYLYNKIRMLADPYPNAFIATADGKKLVIKLAQIGSEDE